MPDIQTIAAIIFLVVLAIFLYLKRKNLDTKQIIPYFLYFSMYKTKLGLKFMDSVAKKYRKFVVYIGYFGVLVGFLGMIFISYGLISNIYVLFTRPEATPGVGLVLPFKAKGIFYVPFFYWIISIFVIAVVHEFSHGLIARAHNLKVKSSGFAFLALIVPIIPAAFVEPDEKELKKRPHKQQLSVFAAGPLANIFVGLLFFGIFLLLLTSIIPLDGVKITDYVKGTTIFPIEKAGIKIGEIILEADGTKTPYVDNLTKILSSKKPGDFVVLRTDKSSYQLKLEKNPKNESSAFMGATLEQNFKIKYEIVNKYPTFLALFSWLIGLFYWVYVLNLGIGLFNLVPIGPLDGGRMLQLVLHKFFDKEKGDKYWSYIGIFFLILIFVNLAAGFVK